MKQVKIIVKHNENRLLIVVTFSLFLLVSIFSLFLATAHAGQNAKIIKWTDKDGVVHYGDVLPSKAAGQRNTVLNKDGIVVKKNQEYLSAEAYKKSVDATQLRKDSALLASYSSVEEIDLAMQRNVATEKNRLEVLQLQLADTQQSLNSQLDKRQVLLAGKQPVPKYLNDDILDKQRKLVLIEDGVIAAKNNIVQIQSRFNAYKVRYAELRPRNQSLSAINVSKQNLSELLEWKRQANKKLNQYLNETINYKRAGKSVPNELALDIQKVNQEIARADQEIASMRASIIDSQQSFSRK